jgi:Uncharacterized conserved protein
MSADDLELGERDHEEAVDFPPSGRTIHTQGYDLSLNTLEEQWDDGTLIIPDFQREYVWDNAKASRLIESLLLNIPIPSLFLSETPDAKYEIVDGHQRVYSVIRYLDNQFPLSGLRIQQELIGLRFFRLPEREQRFLRTRVIRAIIISADSAPEMKFEVFERLNTGGLALNAQEVRNAIYRGTLNEELKRLENDPGLRLCLGTKSPRRRMVDRELILRFWALSDHLDAYRPPLLRFLNSYMLENRDAHPKWLHDRAERFSRTTALVASVLGQSAFRVIDGDGHPLERNINRAVFDAQMLVFSVADPKVARARRTNILRGFGGLFEDVDFLDAIRRATGDRSRTHDRVRDVASAMSDAGVPLDLAALGKL